MTSPHLSTTQTIKGTVRRLLPVCVWATVLSAGINVLMLTGVLFMLQLFDRIIPSRRIETLILLVLMATVAYAVWGGLDWARSRLMARAVEWLEHKLASATVLAGTRSHLAGVPTGAQGLRDLQLIRGFIGGRPAMAFFDAPWAFIFFVALWFMHPYLLIYAVVVVLMLIGLTVAGEYLTRRSQDKVQKLQLTSQRWVEAAINQAEAVTAMGMQQNLLSHYQNDAAATRKASDQVSRWLEAITSLSKTMRQMAQTGIMAYGAWLMIDGQVSPGVVIGGSILLGRAMMPIDQLTGSWRQLMAVRTAWGRLDELLKKTGTEKELTELPVPNARMSVSRLSARASSDKNVNWLLRDVAFNLEAGQALAVIGPSGAGKTSLCRVLAGLIHPEIGEVRLDGARLDQWHSDALGVHIGYLPQNVGLPPATVAQTIARLEEKPDVQDIHRAAMAAGAHEMILSLPKGYDTPVGAGGVPLSGGQQQRIGLARALYRDPVFLILDEPDAHMDQAGEQSLQTAIEEAKARGAIVIITAHRPSMLRCVDTILLLQNGKIQQFGPRDAVLKSLQGDNVDTMAAVRARHQEGRASI